MYAVFIEVDNSGEEREARVRGLREELAPAMKQTPGFRSGVCATNDAAGTGFMLIVCDTQEQTQALAARIVLGSHPRPGVKEQRVEVAEVAAVA